ncbi:MAG: hypothetical protein J6X28_04385 [Bacilli bacterium]|nr:hypothetical protein [Bacilli bacterium]
MNTKNSLVLGRGIFMMIVIVSLGLLIINEKQGDLLKTKVSKKIDEYLETNYENILSNINKEEVKYKNNEFTAKIMSKENKKLYFTVKYKNKNITDTYQKDYEEGKTLLTSLNKSIENTIQEETNIDCKVHEIKPFNKYSEKVQERLLKEEDLIHLKYYYIEKELEIDSWEKEGVTKEIEKVIKPIKEKEITPKYYEITLVNKEDITTTITISNITEEFLELEEKEEIIDDIIHQKNTERVKNSKITYK